MPAAGNLGEGGPRAPPSSTRTVKHALYWCSGETRRFDWHFHYRPSNCPPFRRTYISAVIHGGLSLARPRSRVTALGTSWSRTARISTGENKLERLNGPGTSGDLTPQRVHVRMRASPCVSVRAPRVRVRIPFVIFQTNYGARFSKTFELIPVQFINIKMYSIIYMYKYYNT